MTKSLFKYRYIRDLWDMTQMTKFQCIGGDDKSTYIRHLSKLGTLFLLICIYVCLVAFLLISMYVCVIMLKSTKKENLLILISSSLGIKPKIANRYLSTDNPD